MSEKDKPKDPIKEKDQKPTADPVPKDPKFFEWLEALFQGKTQFPEALILRVITGKNGERFGPIITQSLYTPAEYRGGPALGGAPNPSTREKIVVLSNVLLARAQQDCDQARVATRYGVFASHFAREVDFYERWSFHLSPQSTYRNTEGRPGDGDEDDVKTLAERSADQAMGHTERITNLYAGALEGVLDRMDKILERQDARIERQDARIEKQAEMLEKALSLEADREDRRVWRKIAQEGAEKGINLALDLAPSVVNAFAGKTLMPSKKSPESIVLEKFFKKPEDGGYLTLEVSNAVFGIYQNEEPHDCIKPGVLSIEQGKILYEVAHCKVSPDALDQIMPGGVYEITMEQVARLQGDCGLTLEQLAPLMAIFQTRLQNKK